MILTPIPLEELPAILADLRGRLTGADPLVAAVFERIADTLDLVPLGVDTPRHRADGIALAHRFGIETIDELPMAAYSWDGRAIRTQSESYVLIHEIGHWLVAPPERRSLVDFGLGAGPETGRVEEANAAICVDRDTQIEEEALSSLIGILWEVELGQPAIMAFLEQNWLEGWDRAACIDNLADNLANLHRRGLIDANYRPIPPEHFEVKQRVASL
ncbi:elongation factor P hydroxylase [Nitrospirillum sp. BR 11164]|uniref:elongation factor P hydroxylase n=1 Tax=Nitrospirillum sp. BR 11164 TaxID=3104324 RepID=UPI002AFF9E65|nr:elongation factor P hydroxylase [Nitrospirillum sp. BR 11164]MEA1650221.1 elongation factor P hydroxylase [Nitrospirillum sp. BR 11164]